MKKDDNDDEDGDDEDDRTKEHSYHTVIGMMSYIYEKKRSLDTKDPW
jgi:hypothetical protein